MATNDDKMIEAEFMDELRQMSEDHLKLVENVLALIKEHASQTVTADGKGDTLVRINSNHRVNVFWIVQFDTEQKKET